MLLLTWRSSPDKEPGKRLDIYFMTLRFFVKSATSSSDTFSLQFIDLLFHQADYGINTNVAVR